MHIYSHRIIQFHSESRKEDTVCHPEPHRGCTQEESNPGEAVRSRLCGNKKERWALVPGGGYDWLVWMIPRLADQWNLSGWGLNGVTGELPGWVSFPLGAVVSGLVSAGQLMVEPWGLVRLEDVKATPAILEFTTLRSINSSIELQILTSDGSKQHLLE